jgi:hypothetical protein
LQFLIAKRFEIFPQLVQLFFLLQSLVIKILDLYPVSDSLEMLDPDPDSMNPDLQH